MILYLYAVVDGLGDVAGMTGIRAEPLATLTFEATTVVAGWMADAPPVEREHLASQDAVVRALHARAASLLPMRFGSTFATVDAAARAVTTLQSDLQERLERARGRDQMTLRIIGAARDAIPLTASTTTAMSGTDYLSARSAKATPPELVPLLDALKSLQHATRVEAGRHPELVATVYQLIDRGRAHEYRAAVEGVRGSLAGRTVRVTGPSPCYAFS